MEDLKVPKLNEYLMLLTRLKPRGSSYFWMPKFIIMCDRMNPRLYLAVYA